MIDPDHLIIMTSCHHDIMSSSEIIPGFGYFHPGFWKPNKFLGVSHQNRNTFLKQNLPDLARFIVDVVAQKSKGSHHRCSCPHLPMENTG